MNEVSVRCALAEAEEFVARCQTVLALSDSDPARRSVAGYLWGSKETGALRRQSMELTRALADLRRG